MSDVRTFRAASMHEAMRIMRRELGEEAIVVNTRSTEQRRMLPWLKAKQEVEVTARAGQDVRRRSRETSDRTLTSSATSASSATSLATPPKPAQATRFSRCDDSRLLSPQQLAEQLEREVLGRVEGAISDSGIELSPSLERLIAKPQTGSSTGRSSVSHSSQTNIPPLTQFKVPSELNDRLDSIQRMLESLNKARHLGGESEVPPELFQLYTELLDADVEDEVARDLSFRLRRHVKPEQLHDHDLCKSLLTGLVESDFRISSPIKTTPGRRRVVALIGPTGVGKTTTIAKLAANFRLRDGKIGRAHV